MGGRGAASGRYFRSWKWHTYGDEYHTVAEFRNIKFIKANEGSTTAPMETRTQGRVYVVINKSGNIKSITYYKGNGMRRKQIDLDHDHLINGEKKRPHTHLGYVHDENGTREPTRREQAMIERIRRLWYNRNGR